MFGQTKQRLTNIENKLENQYELIADIYGMLKTKQIQQPSTEREVKILMEKIKKKDIEINELKQKVNGDRKPRRKNITKTSRKGRISEEEKQEMLRLFDGGFTVGEIARALERSSSAVGTYLHDMLDGTEAANRTK